MTDEDRWWQPSTWKSTWINQSINQQLFIDLLFWLRTQTLESDAWIQNPIFPWIGDLSLGEFQNLSELQYPPLNKEENNYI